jgi:hypothetical protein
MVWDATNTKGGLTAARLGRATRGFEENLELIKPPKLFPAKLRASTVRCDA